MHDLYQPYSTRRKSKFSRGLRYYQDLAVGFNLIEACLSRHVEEVDGYSEKNGEQKQHQKKHHQHFI